MTLPELRDALKAATGPDRRSMRDQSQRLGRRFFMKQMTDKAPIPADLLVREFPT